MSLVCLGPGVVPGNDRSQAGINGIIRNDAIVKKKNEHIEDVLKNIRTIYKLTNVERMLIG